jgi:hypothetical protein
MFDAYLQFFPACALLVTLFFILRDEWLKEDARLRRRLHGRLYQVDGRPVILQGNGKPIMFLEGYSMPCRPLARCA